MTEDEIFELKLYLREHLSLDVKTESHMQGTGPYEWKESDGTIVQRKMSV